MACIELKLQETGLLLLLSDKGYEIEIEEVDGTKYVTYTGRHSQPYKAPNSYTTEFTDHEIRKDQALKLMRWAGLYPHIALDYA